MGKVVERADWFELILEAIDEAIHVVDDRGMTIFYNHNAAKFDSLQKEEVIGKYILDVYPSLTEKTSTLMHVLRTGKPIYHSLQTYLNKNGERIETVNTTLPIIEDHELIGAVEVAKDVSKLSALSNRLGQKKRTQDAAEAVQMHDFASFLTNDPLLKEMLERAKKQLLIHHQLLSTGKQGQEKKCSFKPLSMNLTGKIKCSFRKTAQHSQNHYLKVYCSDLSKGAIRARLIARDFSN